MSEKETRLIKHLGQQINTTFFKDLTDNEYKDIVDKMYEKPSFDLVKQQMTNIYMFNQTTNNYITDYYFKDLMYDTKIYYNKWSVSEMLQSKELVGSFVKKTQCNDKVYPQDKPLIDNFKTALRLGGKAIASQVSNFPLDVADMIIRAYNVNGNYYDYSCGWGVRLTSAMKNCINYYGTDPNYLLVDRLRQYANDFKKQTFSRSNVNIYCQGSEIFIPQLKGKIGLAFSSPPYFYLEDYKHGNQSYKQGTTYQEWLSNYMKPTIENIFQYLCDNGYFCMNINNFDKYKLVENVKEIAEQVGFKLYDCIYLENIKRINEKGGLNDNGERIMVFVKPNHPKLRKEHNVNEINQLGQMSLFDL